MLSMERHWRELIDMGPKPCGSFQGDRAAKYILEAVRPHCPEVHFAPFVFDGWRNRGESSLELTAPIERQIPAYAFLGSGGGAFEGMVCHVGLNHIWRIYNWDRYAVICEGEIVAYISGRPDGDVLSQTLVEGNCALPHLIVGKVENDFFLECLARGDVVRVRGFANCEAVPDMPGANIIAPFCVDNPSKKPIVITAHRDTMYNTPGGYDNQAGVSVLIALAEQLAGMRLERDVTLAFTDGEECRLAGGTHLAKGYESGQLDFMLNVDGIGRGDEMEIWCGPVDFERRIMRALLSDPEFPKQCYRNPPPPGSDHAPFYDMGVPSCMFTFNDQGIIHTTADGFNERILPNMSKMLDLVLKMLML